MSNSKQYRKDRLNRKKRNIIILVVLLLFVSIGFALLSTTLDIRGVSTIKNSTWNVHFKNLYVTKGSVAAYEDATIQDDELNISYTINLNKPGDYYEFTVDVVNDGTINAKLKELPVISGVSDEQDVYINYSFTHTDGTPIVVGEKLNIGKSTNFKVRVEFDNNITNDSQLPKDDQILNLDISIKYEQS